MATNQMLTSLSKRQHQKNVAAELLQMFQADRQVGDLIRMDFDSADVLIHDADRQLVGGIPNGCLLIATRIDPTAENITELDIAAHSSSFLLLRCLGNSRLPNNVEMEFARLEAGKRSSQRSKTWDEDGTTDQFTLHQMRFAGLHCRILGMFRMHGSGDHDWTLRFGEDVSNFYAGQGMKIYKPSEEALERLVNFTKDDGQHGNVPIGKLRYAASIHDLNTPESVTVKMRPDDLIAQRSALFGMTRTGKSNTTKVIASAVFLLRNLKDGERVGQLIFDPNGEYANENPQDQGCLRNIAHANGIDRSDVVTYGMYEHPNDPDRNITLLNFYGNEISSGPMDRDIVEKSLETLLQGKDVIDDALMSNESAYVRDFRNASLVVPNDIQDRGSATRYKRAIFIYRAILTWAGFAQPSYRANVSRLFSKEMRDVMDESDLMRKHVQVLKRGGIMWDEAARFCEDFAKWVGESDFKTFDREYAEGRPDGRNWSDNRLLNLLRIFQNTAGRSLMQGMREWHSTTANTDYASDIVRDVRSGRLVIFDQALGNPDMNRQASERIMSSILQEQQRAFTHPEIIGGEVQKPPPVIAYVEEAHTLLPRGEEKDTRNVWARVAKEGAKFNIGLAYSTQEPSSIQVNILRNTENWFIAHLNNTDETRELAKYNDFADFVDSIRRVKEIGFLKVRTRSSPYTLSVQIDKFETPSPPQLPNSHVALNGAQQGSFV